MQIQSDTATHTRDQLKLKRLMLTFRNVWHFHKVRYISSYYSAIPLLGISLREHIHPREKTGPEKT
jgi:hypothetical protein